MLPSMTREPGSGTCCGTSKESYERLNKIIKKYPDFKFICIDVANGYSENFSKFVAEVRNKHPKKIIMSGSGLRIS